MSIIDNITYQGNHKVSCIDRIKIWGHRVHNINKTHYRSLKNNVHSNLLYTVEFYKKTLFQLNSIRSEMNFVRIQILSCLMPNCFDEISQLTKNELSPFWTFWIPRNVFFCKHTSNPTVLWWPSQLYNASKGIYK